MGSVHGLLALIICKMGQKSFLAVRHLAEGCYRLLACLADQERMAQCTERKNRYLAATDQPCRCTWSHTLDSRTLVGGVAFSLSHVLDGPEEELCLEWLLGD